MTPKRAPKKKKDPRGRKPVTDTIRANWIDGGRTVRFSISEDLVNQLKRAHNEMFRVFYMTSLARQSGYDPFKAMRIEFMRFDDITMPGVLLRIEPPTFDPHGHRLWKDKRGERWFTQGRASKLGVRDGMAPVGLEYLFQPSEPRLLGGGIMVIFPDHYMLYEGRKTTSRRVYPAKPIR